MSTKATKLPSGNWRVRVQLPSADGKQHYKSFTAATRKEAEYLAAQFALVPQAQESPVRITLSRAMELYIQNRINVLSPTTIASYKKYQRNYFSDLSLKCVCDITTTDAQSLINNVSAGRSPKTVREVYSFFRSVVRQFNDSFSPRVNLPARVKHEMQIPTEDKVLSMIKTTQGTPLGVAILLSALCGIRRGEISALTRADVDVNACTLTVNKSLAKSFDGKWITKSPKSYAGTRTISVDASIVNRILPLAPLPDDRICPIPPDSITKQFIMLRNSFGLTIRFHDLRHYNASIMLSLGVPDKYAMERLGQRTPGVIKDVYQHIMDSKRKEVSLTMANAAASFLEKI